MLSHILFLVSLPAIALGAQQIPVKENIASPFTAHFDKLVAQSLHRWHTPGLAIAVIDGQDTFSKVRCHFSTEESSQIHGFVPENKISIGVGILAAQNLRIEALRTSQCVHYNITCFKTVGHTLSHPCTSLEQSIADSI